MLAVNAGQFKREMAAAADAVSNFGHSLGGPLRALDRLGDAVTKSALKIGAATASFAALTVKAASDIQTPMNNVATVWDEAGQRINGTFMSLADAQQEVINLSTQLPQTATQLAEGLYNVASSGFQGSEGLEVLSASAKAASAGLTDTETATRAVTGVLNAFGLGTNKVTDVTDTMFQIVNRGVITFEELAQNMGDIAPIAASAGISFAEAGAAMATMTLSGLPATEAATSLQGAIRGLIDPNKEMAATLKEAGYESGAAAVQALGLGGVLNLLRERTGNQADAWLQLFEDSRAARGAMAAMAQDGKVFADVSRDITDVSARQGATQAALGKQSQSLSFQLQQLRNTITAVAAQLGQALLPVVSGITTALQGVVGAFQLLPAPLYTFVSGTITATGALTALAGLWLVHIIRGKLFTAVINLATAALNRFGVSTRIAGAALTALKFAQGAAVGLVGVFSLMSISMGKAQESAQAMIAELNKGIDTSTYAGLNELLDTQNRQLDKTIEKNKAYAGVFGWVRAAGGNIVGTLGGALGIAENKVAKLHEAEQGLREETEKNAIAAARWKDNVDAFAHATGMTTEEVEELARASNIDLTQGFYAAQEALGKAAGGMNEAEIAATKLKATLTAVGEEVAKQFNLASAWTNAQAAATSQLQASAQAAKEAAQSRYEHAIERIDKEEQAERDSLDRRKEARQQALDDEHEMYLDAIEERYDALEDALEKEERAEEQAMERRHRDQDQALDRQHRAEERALDERLKLLDREADKRKTAAEREYEAERDRIQWMIDNTFGAEREAWKAQLITLEDNHDDRLAIIDDETDKAKQIEKDNLADRQQEEKNVLNDRQQEEKNVLTDRYNTLTEHLRDREQAEKAAETTRYNNAKTALGEEFKQYDTHLDNKYKRLRQHEEDRKKCEDDAADARYNSQDAKQKLAAQLYDQFLKDQLKAAAEHNRNLAILASRGGVDVMTEIAKLPPEILAEQLKKTPEEFDAWLESVRALLAVGGSLAKTGVEAGMHYGAPNRIFGNAAGGILRFADGGEYHVAQMASAGDWRLWAEPETGGEAYIPLARSKRARSTSILAQVANSFGYGLVSMANGAGPGGGGAGGITFNLSIEARVAAGVDPDAVGRAIALHTKRAVDEALDAAGRRVVMTRGGR